MNFTELKNKKWFKKAGIITIILFLIKGLIWIGLIIWAWIGLSK
jgi:hypothetical protein